MSAPVLPEGSATGPALRVQSTSKLAFGATTVALVVLASSGTAILVDKGIPSLAGPTALPGGSPRTGSTAGGPVVVDRAAGTVLGLGKPAPVVAPDATVRALRDALLQRPGTGPRTVVAPLTDLGGVVVQPVGQPVLAPPLVAPGSSAPVLGGPARPAAPQVGKGVVARSQKQAERAAAAVSKAAQAAAKQAAKASKAEATKAAKASKAAAKKAAQAAKASKDEAKKAARASKAGKASKAAKPGKHDRASKAAKAARKAAHRAARAQERALKRADRAKRGKADRRHGGGRHLL